MPFALDHLFVCCAPGAPEGDALSQHGLREGSPNTHPGQGTANRLFFFSNLYLELLFVSDAAQAQSSQVRPTQLYERCQHRQDSACPFGIILRSTDYPSAPPFEAWPYRPAYLPPQHCIQIATGTPLAEPGLFYLDFARQNPTSFTEPLNTSAGIDAIPAATLHGPGLDRPSAALQALVAANLLALSRSPQHLLELHFTGSRTTPLDLRPTLPILFTPAIVIA